MVFYKKVVALLGNSTYRLLVGVYLDAVCVYAQHRVDVNNFCITATVCHDIIVCDMLCGGISSVSHLFRRIPIFLVCRLVARGASHSVGVGVVAGLAIFAQRMWRFIHFYKVARIADIGGIVNAIDVGDARDCEIPSR